VNNGFGINFLRYICEEDASSWSQIFARLPFDEAELKQKGALFGLIKNDVKENWAEVEMEITNWVEEYFNGVEVGGNLADFFGKFDDKYDDFESLWVWITMEGLERKIKIVGKGGVKIVICRKETKINLSENLKRGKVISGDIGVGDEIRMWLGALSDDFETWDGEVANQLSCFSAFKITIGEMNQPVVESDGSQITEEAGDSLEVVDEPQVEVVPAKVESGSNGIEEVKIFENESLATDKIVGKLTFILKIKNWLRRRNFEKVDRSVMADKRKKFSLVLGGVFLVLLGLSLVFGGLQKKSNEYEKKWLSFSEPIEKNISEAVGLGKLNPGGSRKLIEDARTSFEQKKTEFGDEKYKEKVISLGKKIDEAWVSVSGEKSGNLTEAVNLDLIRAGVNASRVSYVSGEKLVVISSLSGLVMSVDTKEKEVKVVAGKGAGLGWIDAVSDGRKVFVMNKGGLFTAGNELSPLAFDTAITDPIAMSRFGANLYVLEKGNKEIFKFLIGESGFGERARWLKEGQAISDIPVDMDIDVDVWVLEEKNQIERFRRGVREPFGLRGLPQGKVFEKISVEKNGDRIALLSSSSGLVVYCSKLSGSCEQQVLSDKLKEARDVEFNEANVLMVLLPGSVGVLN